MRSRALVGEPASNGVPRKRSHDRAMVADRPGTQSRSYSLQRRMDRFTEQETTTPMSTRPNIVLVHGAWADGSSWSAVIERLQAAGHHVIAPQFPLTSLADDVTRLRQVLE